MNDDEKKSGAPEEQPSGEPANAAPILIGFAVFAVLMIAIGWLTQP